MEFVILISLYPYIIVVYAELVATMRAIEILHEKNWNVTKLIFEAFCK
jgi:hypothetical protein